MKDESRTKKQLISELVDLRRELAGLQNCAEEVNQLKESNEKFIKAFLQCSIPMTVTTIEEGRFVDVNEAFLNLIGMTRNEVIGNTATALGYINDIQQQLFFAELKKNGRIDNMEAPIRTSKGDFKYGLFNVIMMSVKKEKYLLAVINDHTERKAAENALRESEERYRSIFRHATTGIFHTIPEKNILQVNPALARMLGYESPEELTAAVTDIEAQLYMDPGKRSGLLAAVLAGSDPVCSEIRYRRKDGAAVTANLSLRKILNSDGTMAYFEGFVEDITAHRQAEEALQRSERHCRLLAECSGNFILCVDEKGEYKFTNQLYASTFGKTPDYFIGKTFWDIYPKEQADRRYEITRRVFQTGAGEALDMEIPLPGRTLCFRAQADPLKDEAGKVVQMLVYSTVINGRPGAENEAAGPGRPPEQLV